MGLYRASVDPVVTQGYMADNFVTSVQSEVRIDSRMFARVRDGAGRLINVVRGICDLSACTTQHLSLGCLHIRQLALIW